MTVKQFMLKKFPTNEYMDCPVPKHHWETIQEYAHKYHEAKVKNLSSNTVLANSEVCPTHKPLCLGYLNWHTEAEKRQRKGMKQKQCEVCKRWLWKDEM